MSHIAFIDVAAELRFDCENPPVAALDDEVDFALARLRAQVEDPCLCGLCENAYAERHERFEEAAEQGTVSRDQRDVGAIEKCVGIHSEQSGG